MNIFVGGKYSKTIFASRNYFRISFQGYKLYQILFSGLDTFLFRGKKLGQKTITKKQKAFLVFGV